LLDEFLSPVEPEKVCPVVPLAGASAGVSESVDVYEAMRMGDGVGKFFFGHVSLRALLLGIALMSTLCGELYCPGYEKKT
jgi:hypothetical protein